MQTLDTGVVSIQCHVFQAFPSYNKHQCSLLLFKIFEWYSILWVYHSLSIYMSKDIFCKYLSTDFFTHKCPVI
jgi:hypothetical protein